MSDRRHFLQTIFAGPAVIAAAEERERVRIEQEHLAKSAQPSIPKPKCGICDHVLINGLCPETECCNFCIVERQNEIRKNGKREVNQDIIHFEGRDWTLLEIYQLKIFTHFVQEKCSVCGNADLLGFQFNGLTSPVSFYGTSSVAGEWNPLRRKVRSM